jgi:hypothetical protein
VRALSAVRAALNLGPVDPTANGFQNLDTTLKYRVFKSPKHEFVLSAGQFDIEALIRSTAQAAATA